MEFSNQKNCQTKLKKLYEKCVMTTVVLVQGHKGTGKTKCITNFLKGNKRTITFCSTGGEKSDLQVIENTLRNCARANCSSRNYFEDDGLTYDEKLLSWMLEIVSTNNNIFYFENLNKWNLYLLSFMQQFLFLLADEYNAYKTVLIFELNDDDDEYLKMQDEFREFFSAIPNLKFINFKKIPNQELKEYFPVLLEGEQNISDDQINYIVEAASGNILLLKMIITYLQQDEYLVCDDNDIWTCHKITTRVLLEAVKKHIQHRYNMLEQTLKDTLKISTLLGIEINPDILQESFQLIDAQENLELIEKLSNLLIRSKDISAHDRYKFENTEVYYYIQNELSNDEKLRWCQTLLKYYYTQRNELSSSKKRSISTDYDLNTLEISMMQVSSIGECFDDAIQILMSLSTRCINILNFKQALDLLEKYKFIYNTVNIEPSIQCRFISQKAYCLESMGQYENAKKIYEECQEKCRVKLNSFFEEYYQFKIAYCTYYMSDVNTAFSLANTTYHNLSKNGKTNLLYFQTVSLLATLYKEKGDYDNAIKFYNTALECCKDNGYEEEYYVQLRKSCLIIEMELAIPMLQQSVNYFQKKQNIKELAKAYHNLGSNYLYTNAKDLSFEMLNNACKSFKSFGSNDIVVSINNLGIWYAIYEDNVSKALELFQQALTYKLNSYKQMTILSNIAICYLLKHDYDNFQQILSQINDNPGISVNTAIPYYQTVSDLLNALYNYHCGNLVDAANSFIIILKNRVTNRQRFLLSNFIIDINKTESITFPPEIANWKDIIPNYLFQLYYQKKIMFRTLRFVE